MSDERDPFLESAFDDAELALEDRDFTQSVMTRIQSRRYRVLFGRIAIVGLLVLLEVLLESPLQQSLGVVAEVLGRSLIPLESEWLAFALAPINSIAGLLGITLLGLNTLYRKLFY